MMKTSTKIIIAGIWLAIAVPQVFISYGSSLDSWLLASTAVEIWESGSYAVSRATGFPLHEILLAGVVPWGGWIAANFTSVFAGFAFLMALFALSDDEHLEYPVLTVVSLAFLPIIVSQATTTIDFMFELALLMWSYVFLTRKRVYLAAVLIGIACGFRPTMGFMVVPAMLWVWREQHDWKKPLLMYVIALAMGIAAFSPALLKQGIGGYSSGASGSLTFLYRTVIGIHNLVHIFGIVQCVMIAVVVGMGLRRLWMSDRSYLTSPHLLYHGSNILMWLGLFFVFPLKSEYYLPAVPSILFLVDRTATRKPLIVLVVLLLSFHVIQISYNGDEHDISTIRPSIEKGHTVKDIETRWFTRWHREVATAFEVDEPTLLMFGETWITADNPSWTFDSTYGLWRQKHGQFFVSHYIADTARIAYLRNRGMKMYIVRDQQPYSQRSLERRSDGVIVIERLDELFSIPREGDPEFLH
jgi:hypothetical protein